MSGTDKQIVIEALGGGPVQVGTGGPAPAGNVTLPLGTVVVVVNPAEPEEAPCCLVADVDESREELADLYGGATAGLASRAAGWGGPGRVGKLPLAPDDEDMAEAVARLGVVRWLQEWSPLPLDWRLLRLEELTLVTSLTGHLADEPDRLPELAELCRYFHDHLDEENFAPLTGLLGDALEQVANWSPLSGTRVTGRVGCWPPGPPGRKPLHPGGWTPSSLTGSGPNLPWRRARRDGKRSSNPLLSTGNRCRAAGWERTRTTPDGCWTSTSTAWSTVSSWWTGRRRCAGSAGCPGGGNRVRTTGSVSTCFPETPPNRC